MSSPCRGGDYADDVGVLAPENFSVPIHGIDRADISCPFGDRVEVIHDRLLVRNGHAQAEDGRFPDAGHESG